MDQTICLLNDSFPPFIDGVANTVLNYARELTNHGYHPAVITPANPQAEDSVYPYPVIRYPSIDARKLTGYMAGIPFSPKIAQQLSREPVALLHSHCPIVSTLMGRQLRQIVDAPLVLTYHTKFDIDIANILHSKMLQAGSKKALLANINACDEIWTVSRGAGENLRSLGYEGEYLVMPNGVDMPRQRVSEEQIHSVTKAYNLPEGVPVYLFVGRMMWYKGLRIILDALRRLKAAGKDFPMVFVGDGTDRDEVEEYARQCGVSEQCIFTGALRDRDALRAWYCRGDLFLFPSTFDTNGLVVREAAACGLASVLIAGSCAAEDVTDGVNGFLIAENDESLFRCLLALHGCRDTLSAVGQNAARDLYVSWEDAVRLAEQRYEVVMERYRSGGYPSHKKPMEYVLKVNGELMEDLGDLLQLRDQIAQHIKGRQR